MSQSIPQGIPIRRVLLNNLSELPHDYGTTPGGTYFSTTPGGTRIIYDRSFLLKCRASPLANTPPTNLPDIPGVTSPEKSSNQPITKIVEENEASVLKENGGKFRQPNIIPSCLASVPFGYDAYINAKGPLQQYRQRSLMQQNAAFYERACQQVSEAHNVVLNTAVNLLPPPPCSPILPLQQQVCLNLPNNYSGDGMWRENYEVPLNKKTYPSSQLSLWRQAKITQAISNAVIQPANSVVQPTTLTPANLPPGHPGLSVYRGRGRGISQRALPGNLCKPMEKLFMSHSGNGMVTNPLHNNSIYNSYTPAYGHYSYGKDAGVQYDNNTNIVQ